MGGDFTSGKQQDTRKGIYALAGKDCYFSKRALVGNITKLSCAINLIFRKNS